MNPDYPIYIISKGRWDTRLTARSLDKMKIPYRIVVEPQEAEAYSKHLDSGKILILPFSDLGQGSIPARNWVWHHSIGEGHDRHWILDDNIRGFRRIYGNKRIRVTDGTIFKIAEDFTDRYENVALSGLQYNMFTVHGATRRKQLPPLIINTRVYSCILIMNSLDFRWRGLYNEDTDLSLRALKAGWCTLLFNHFSCEKVTTMVMAGGNTDQLYAGDGRWRMAESLLRQHPDIVKIDRRWNRWQHVVDYKGFKSNQLRFRPGFVPPTEPNDYGMRLTRPDNT